MFAVAQISNFENIGIVNVRDASAAVHRESAHFSDEKRRQNYPGSAHPDSETIYLRMPTMLSVDSVFNSLDVKNYPLASVPEFADLLDDVAAQINGRPARAMIVKLKGGGKVHPHIDQGIYADATDRYHVPLMTNDRVRLFSGTESAHIPEGEIWWFNNHIMHSAVNGGAEDRVHLIIDFFRETR